MVGSCAGRACCLLEEDLEDFSGCSAAREAFRWRKESNNLRETSSNRNPANERANRRKRGNEERTQRQHHSATIRLSSTNLVLPLSWVVRLCVFMCVTCSLLPGVRSVA